MPFYLKRFSFLLLTFLLVMHVSTVSASGNEGEKEKSFDIKEMIFSHARTFLFIKVSFVL